MSQFKTCDELITTKVENKVCLSSNKKLIEKTISELIIKDGFIYNGILWSKDSSDSLVQVIQPWWHRRSFYLYLQYTIQIDFGFIKSVIRCKSTDELNEIEQKCINPINKLQMHTYIYPYHFHTVLPKDPDAPIIDVINELKKFIHDHASLFFQTFTSLHDIYNYLISSNHAIPNLSHSALLGGVIRRHFYFAYYYLLTNRYDLARENIKLFMNQYSNLYIKRLKEANDSGLVPYFMVRLCELILLKLLPSVSS